MLLLDIPVIFICPDHNEKYRERKEYMFNFLEKLGFKNVTMFKSRNDLCHTKCIADATFEILSSNLNDSPLLLLEDDIELSEWVTDMNIEIPENTDAFYLGFSKYAGSYIVNSSIGYNSAAVEVISEKHVRVLNMLAAHAILYISKRYKQSVINEMKTMLNSNISMISDVLIARLQPQFNIYAYKYPFFFQSENLGNNWYAKDATNFRF